MLKLQAHKCEYSRVFFVIDIFQVRKCKVTWVTRRHFSQLMGPKNLILTKEFGRIFHRLGIANISRVAPSQDKQISVRVCLMCARALLSDRVDNGAYY